MYLSTYVRIIGIVIDLFIEFLQEYTRGPCPEGKLMVLDRDTGYGKCSCDNSLVK